MTHGMRVLFLEADSLTAEVRIRPLLDVLRATGKIGGYTTIDRDMAAHGERFARYDVVLMHRNPNRRQIGWIQRHSAPFVYDIDDLLLGLPADKQSSKRRAEQRSISWSLLHASVVTPPSRRLSTTLEQRLHRKFASAQLLPNAGAEVPPAAKPAVRPRLLWVSSALPQWPGEIDAIARGIAAGAIASEVEILLVGRFPEAVRAMLPRHEIISWLDHASYRRLLAEKPLIAVAPLGAALPESEQCFLDCKSDIKAAEYGSNRVAAAYSSVPPYIESDLPCPLIVKNASEDWRDAVERLARNFPDEGNRLADHASFAARRPSVLAQRLLLALEHARQSGKPSFTYRAISTPRFARTLERKVRRLFSRRREPA